MGSKLSSSSDFLRLLLISTRTRSFSVGWDSKYTVAVWVGYPDKLVPMTTDFNGQPVLGGTYPALIWHQFMVAASAIDKARAEHSKANLPGGGTTR